MRWLALYARSRRVPSSLAAALAGAAVVWGAARLAPHGLASPALSALVLLAGVAPTAAGLSGQDAALDRTAALRWAPRRAAHLAAIGLWAAAVLWTLLAVDAVPAQAAFLLRDSAGLMGLAGLGAALFGGAFAWTLPLAWFVPALFVRPGTGTASVLATWLVQPPFQHAAAWTAAALAVVGAAAYAARGAR